MSLVNRTVAAFGIETGRTPAPSARNDFSGADRDLEARWADQLHASRAAFAALVLQLPEVYRDFILDGDLTGPRLGHRWPLVQLGACFRRMSRCAPVNDDPATVRVVAELRRHKDKIDRANQALILANLRLAIRVGKSLNGHEIAKLRHQLAAASDPGGLPSRRSERSSGSRSTVSCTSNAAPCGSWEPLARSSIWTATCAANEEWPDVKKVSGTFSHRGG